MKNMGTIIDMEQRFIGYTIQEEHNTRYNILTAFHL